MGKQDGFLRKLRAQPEQISVPVFGISVILIWEFLVTVTGTPEYLMPGPVSIAKTLWRLISKGAVASHIGITASEVLIGYGLAIIAGITLGTLISQVPMMKKLLEPYLIAFGAVPKIALAPLFIIWFGFGITSKIVVAALVAFFPLLINTINGLNATDMLKIELFKSLGATRWQTFRMLKVPNAMPYIFAGLDIGAVFSVSGAIVGEFVGSQGGLGHLALYMQYEFDIPGYFAVLFIIVPFGLFLHLLVVAAQKRVVFWVHDERQKVKDGVSS